ncbi:hypothetical protein BC939DRAFT_461935 [Gamsiella multidivaricata]|uniref:uncharacterized protein n=1 Tax=Gamsiella multidivaricata TaxID=101098 RepID=UPI0022208064|nr:uncharacterized protein BC939DRAFT_461935 [Gamsiella multidivaricata]KAI7818762.1 hypothetical protein BC939DRAFT_461935 [Gamsiella multidivaricata]
MKAEAVVTAIASMLLFLFNRQANYLQLLTGLYLYGNGTARSVIGILSKIGLTVSHQTIHRTLRALSNDASTKAREAANTKPFYIVYDNINIAFRKHDQRLFNQDSFDNGTTATLIVSDVTAEEEMETNSAKHLRFKDLLPKHDHNIAMFETFRFHLVGVLQRRVETFKSCSWPTPTIKLLPVNATKTYPLPLMQINQATVQGNKDILETIMEIELQLPPEWFDGRRILIAGDQLTTIRVHSLKNQRWDDISTYHRHEYAIPIMQLFHLQMLLGATILRHHYGSAATPGSIAFNASLLNRKRVSLDKPDFHATDELLRQSFEAMALRAWEIILECDSLSEYQHNGTEAELLDLVGSKVNTILERFIMKGNQEHLADVASRNAALFLRDMMLYIELASAIKCGDTGRLENVIKHITVIFQAGSTKNYANELLLMHIGLHYSWSPQTRRAVLSCMLVNPTGKEGRFIPTDLYQEHNNLRTKEIHGLRGRSANWGTMGRAVSTNIRTFDEIGKEFQKAWGITPAGTNHTTVPDTNDINAILQNIQENGILGNDIQPLSDIEGVSDLFEDGMVKLMKNGYLESFIDRNTRLRQQTESDGRASPMSVDDEINSEMDAEVDEDMDDQIDNEVGWNGIEFGIDDYVQVTAE